MFSNQAIREGSNSFHGTSTETQDHLEICDGTKFERRGVRVSEVMGRVIFWRRMTQKMTQKTATVTSTPEVHLPDAPSGGSSTTLGVYK